MKVPKSKALGEGVMNWKGEGGACVPKTLPISEVFERAALPQKGKMNSVRE